MQLIELIKTMILRNRWRKFRSPSKDKKKSLIRSSKNINVRSRKNKRSRTVRLVVRWGNMRTRLILCVGELMRWAGLWKLSLGNLKQKGKIIRKLWMSMSGNRIRSTMRWWRKRSKLRRNSTLNRVSCSSLKGWSLNLKGNCRIK